MSVCELRLAAAELESEIDLGAGILAALRSG